MKSSWYERWMSAYEQASFYKTEKNSAAYWDAAAENQSEGLPGKKHIDLIMDYLIENRYLDENTTVLDAGCGTGNYALELAKYCKHVTAMDYSGNMLEICRSKADELHITNMSYLLEDIGQYDKNEKYDGVFACLNPSAYSPEIFCRLLKMSKKFLVYFSMDTPVENVNEPVYCGSNSVRYPENYLDEVRIPYTKIQYEYVINQKDKNDIRVPFAYIIVIVNDKLRK